jgi:hypothetical protein
MLISVVTEDYIGAPGEESCLVLTEDDGTEVIYFVNIPQEDFEVTVKYKDSDFINHTLNYYNYEV